MKQTDLRTAMDRRLSGLKADEQHVHRVLSAIKGERPMKKKTVSLALVFAIIALVSVAVAAVLSPTIEWFTKQYGQDTRDVLEKGTAITVDQRKTLGPLTYEWVDTIVAKDMVDLNPQDVNMLYGTLRITPQQGENVVLIPEDYPLDAPFGYNIFLGEKAPDGAQTILQKAEETGARIILAKAVPDGLVIDGQEVPADEVGYDFEVAPDNSLTYHFMLPGAPHDLESYTVNMYIANWEVRSDGQWLRGEKDEQGKETEDTWLREQWHVTIRPR